MFERIWFRRRVDGAIAELGISQQTISPAWRDLLAADGLARRWSPQETAVVIVKQLPIGFHHIHVELVQRVWEVQGRVDRNRVNSLLRAAARANPVPAAGAIPGAPIEWDEPAVPRPAESGPRDRGAVGDPRRAPRGKIGDDADFEGRPEEFHEFVELRRTYGTLGKDKLADLLASEKPKADAARTRAEELKALNDTKLREACERYYDGSLDLQQLQHTIEFLLESERRLAEEVRAYTEQYGDLTRLLSLMGGGDPRATVL